jgi:hypothetical protein
MSYIPPTDKEKELLRGYLSAHKEIFKDLQRSDDGVLYVRDIRHKLKAAVAAAGLSFTDVVAIENLHGIELTFDDTGAGILPTYTVTDEQKYLMFLMKF